MTSAPESLVGHRLSEAEYLALPETKPYLEYLDGEVVQKAMPNEDHLRLAHELDGHLWLYRRAHGGTAGPEGRVRFARAGRVFHRLPDIAYWAPDRPVGTAGTLLPPTLAIEIRSPDETMAEQRAKCRFYQDYGVDVAWLVDPASRTVEVFEGGVARVLQSGDVLDSGYLPGFALPLADLFAVLDR